MNVKVFRRKKKEKKKERMSIVTDVNNRVFQLLNAMTIFLLMTNLHLFPYLFLDRVTHYHKADNLPLGPDNNRSNTNSQQNHENKLISEMNNKIH